MKFSTEKNTKFIKSVYWLIIVFVGGFYLFNYFISIKPVLAGKDMLAFTITVMVLGIYWYLRARHFEYDSNGEVLIFKNTGVLFYEVINYREHKAEFPKGKLYDYKLKDYILYRKLYIYVKSKEGRVKKTSFDVTFVSPKRIKYLKQSLNKVLKENKSANEHGRR